MKLTIEIYTETQVFGNEPHKETGRMLRRLADHIDDGLPFCTTTLRDTYGEAAGLMRIEERSDGT